MNYRGKHARKRGSNEAKHALVIFVSPLTLRHLIVYKNRSLTGVGALIKAVPAYTKEKKTHK